MRYRKRIIRNNKYYHITNRGVARRPTFLDNDDYITFMNLVRKGCGKYDVKIVAMCVMPNHFHFLVWAIHANKVSRCLQWITSIYAKYFNRRYDRNGHLWQDRFYAKEIYDGLHLGVCWRYVEQNPVRARLVGNALDWKWSSSYMRASGIETLFLVLPHWWGTETMDEWWSDKLLKEDMLQKIRRSISATHIHDDIELWI